MTKYYLTKNGVTELIDKPQKDCWVCMTDPTEEELGYIAGYYRIDDMDDLKAALDEEESSRVDIEDNYSLILFDIPSLEERNEKNRYVTIPLGVILTEDAVITVCLKENPVLDFFQNKRNRNTFGTGMKTRFLLQILLHNAELYLKSLRVINKQSEELEKTLNESVENAALIDMMELGKSLLYFTTSLKSLNKVLDKIQKLQSIKKYPEDEELLDDVVIEARQALEMAEVYNGLLNGMMDAYASIISNNMNVVMKFLAIASIVLSIPNIVFGAYGMNIKTSGMPFAELPGAFWIIVGISVVLSVIVGIYFNRKKMY